MRAAARILTTAAVLLLVGSASLIVGARAAEAACARSCPASQRDEHGCCPDLKRAEPRPPIPKPTAPPSVKLGKLAPLCVTIEACVYGCRQEQRPAMCARAAELYESGRGRADVALDDALRYYTRACDRGVAEGCAGLAGLQDRGAGMPIDDAAAAKAYRKSCDAGVARACEGLARMQLLAQAPPAKGEPVALIRRAELLLGRDCQRDVDGACLRLVAFHDPIAGLRPDPAAMRTALARAQAYAHARCEKGYVDSCVIEAELQLDPGRNPAAKPAEAAARLGILCTEGSPAACGALASHLRLSRGADDPELVEAARTGCADKMPVACVALGQLEEGAGHLELAANAYDVACSAGDPVACTLAAAVLGRQGKPQQAEASRARACTLSHHACSVPVGAAPRPRVALRSSCGLTFDGIWQVGAAGQGLVVIRPGERRLQLTLNLPKEAGRWSVHLDKAVDARVVVLLANADVAYGNFPAQANSARVAGEVEVRTFDPETGFVEVDFRGVRLIDSAKAECELDGTLQTYGRDY